MFRASSAHLQEDTVVHMQNYGLLILDRSPVYRVTVPYAACVQVCPEDEHLRLETCKGE